jgi:hypothetical protein
MSVYDLCCSHPRRGSNNASCSKVHFEAYDIGALTTVLFTFGQTFDARILGAVPVNSEVF